MVNDVKFVTMLQKHRLSLAPQLNNTYKINHQFNCNEKCLVYLLTCNKCFKQYAWQTVDEFRRRWDNYKSNDRKFQMFEPCMQEHLLVIFQ